MKQSIYFSHDSDARNDLKIKALIKKYGIEGYGVYWVFIEIMRMQNDYKLSKKTYVLEGISDEIGKEIQYVHGFIDDCISFELFASDDQFIWSESFLNRMGKKDEIIELRRLAGKKSADMRKKPPDEPTLAEHMLNTTSTINKQTNEMKEINKENLKEQKLRLLQRRKQLFIDRVMEFKTTYPGMMLKDFISYWSEINKSGSQMKWEMEKTWEFSRRLERWSRNDKSFVKTDTPKTYAEMLKMAETDPDVFKKYDAVRKDGERQATFYPKKP
jgi:hypothetical protein